MEVVAALEVVVALVGVLRVLYVAVSGLVRPKSNAKSNGTPHRYNLRPTSRRAASSPSRMTEPTTSMTMALSQDSRLSAAPS